MCADRVWTHSHHLLRNIPTACEGADTAAAWLAACGFSSTNPGWWRVHELRNPHSVPSLCSSSVHVWVRVWEGAAAVRTAVYSNLLTHTHTHPKMSSGPFKSASNLWEAAAFLGPSWELFSETLSDKWLPQKKKEKKNPLRSTVSTVFSSPRPKTVRKMSVTMSAQWWIQEGIWSEFCSARIYPQVCVCCTHVFMIIRYLSHAGS